MYLETTSRLGRRLQSRPNQKLWYARPIKLELTSTLYEEPKVFFTKEFTTECPIADEVSQPLLILNILSLFLFESVNKRSLTLRQGLLGIIVLASAISRRG